MPTSRISNTILGPSGTPLNEVAVTAKLMPQGSFRIATFTEVARIVSTITNASGLWQLDLEEQANINPANTTWYEVTEHIPDVLGGRRVWNISVGASDQTLYASLVTPSYSNPVVVSTDQVTYLTQQSADARYQALGALGATPNTIEPDDPAAAGVSTTAARADHEHGIVAAAAVNTGDANAEGTATSFARSDHVHKGVVANDAWTSYTPTLAQPAITTVTKTVLYAKWTRIGRTILVQVDLQVTGTGTASEPVIIGLPVEPATPLLRLIGTGAITDSSASAEWQGQAILYTSTSVGIIPPFGGGGWLGDVEFTAALANNDHVYLNLMYEAAS